MTMMSPAIEKILHDALELPDDARADLAAALLDSIDHDPPDEGVDEAWQAEAKRRLAEIRSGVVKPIPWDKAEPMIFDSSDAPKDR
jgi:putative addiction module component (TIGR02574 family)